MSENTTDATRSEAGRSLAALRQMHERVCAYCGKPFQAFAKGQYCSPSHRQLAYRRRKHEAAEASSDE